MKPLPFLLTLLLLAACAPVTAVPASTQACTAPGETRLLYVERVGQVNLYLPPCYDANPANPYPVLYLLPGQGGMAQDWANSGLAGIADQAILAGEIRPLLIVMTEDTFDDATRDNILDTLIPFIESHYPVSRDRRFRAAAGGSLGGASAYWLTFGHPEMFSSAGVFGNGLVTNGEEKMRALLATIPVELKPRVFLSSGERDPYMLEHARLLIPLLDEAGIEHAEAFGPGGHDYQTWLSNFPAYFRWLEQGWE